MGSFLGVVVEFGTQAETAKLHSPAAWTSHAVGHVEMSRGLVTWMSRVEWPRGRSRGCAAWPIAWVCRVADRVGVPRSRLRSRSRNQPRSLSRG